jgi:hypothetical protein
MRPLFVVVVRVMGLALVAPGCGGVIPDSGFNPSSGSNTGGGGH